MKRTYHKPQINIARVDLSRCSMAPYTVTEYEKGHSTTVGDIDED